MSEKRVGCMKLVLGVKHRPTLTNIQQNPYIFYISKEEKKTHFSFSGIQTEMNNVRKRVSRICFGCKNLPLRKRSGIFLWPLFYVYVEVGEYGAASFVQEKELHKKHKEYSMH